MKISTRQLERKWWEDYGKRGMKPNNVRSGYFVGYRRALRDMENTK